MIGFKKLLLALTIISAASGASSSNDASKAVAASGGSAASSAPSSASSTGGSGSGIQGEVSFYTEWKSNKGSCGFIPTDGNIAAVNAQFMPAKCNQCIMVNYNGKSIKVKATDTCPGCSAGKLDLSDEAFQKLDSLSKGILKVTWNWVPC